jgi:hypothetical protein
MDAIAAWVGWASAWLAGIGVTGTAGLAVLAWVRKMLVRRTAEKIEAHMAAALPRDVTEIMLADITLSRERQYQNRHACNYKCLTEARVLGRITRVLFARRAFTYLVEEERLVYHLGSYYVRGTQPGA